MIAGKIANMKQGARTDLASIEAKSKGQAAQMLNVGKATVERARTVLDHGIPQLQKAVERDKIAVSEASQIAKLDSRALQAARWSKSSSALSSIACSGTSLCCSNLLQLFAPFDAQLGCGHRCAAFGPDRIK